MRTYSAGSWVRGSLLALAMTLVAQSAMALPIASLVFRDPTGIVGPNDPIAVWLTLTLDPQSSPLTTDGTGVVTSGYSPGDLTSVVPGTETNSSVNNSFQCGGTFTSACTTGPPYNFGFAFPPQGFPFSQNLNLQPGNSYDFLFGTFTPSAGPVAPGTYTFYNASFFIGVSGLDANGDPTQDTLVFAQTCPTQDAACAFTRTVRDVAAPVPEPGTWALFGLTGLGWAIVRRRRATR